MSFLDDWKEWSTTKKAISILVVCCIGLIIIGAFTGGGSPDKNTGTTTSSSDDNTSADNTTTTTDDATTEATGTYVKISYSGKWSGAISTGGSTRSISGSGDETIDIDESGMVSANAQKKDGSSKELQIQIIKDGEVVEESSTDAEYGIAQVSGFV